MSLRRSEGPAILSRDDITALTQEAAEISGIQYIMDADREEVDQLLES